MSTRTLLLLLIWQGASFAQTNLASIGGVISDPQGRLVPDAAVVVTNTGTDVKATSTTNNAGFYNVENLPIGIYTVTVEHTGFRTLVRHGITVTTGESLGLNLRLQLGSVDQTVNVTSEGPPLETRTSDITQLVETKSVQNLPLGNRRTLNIVELTGAAVFVAYQNNPGVSNPAFSLAGGRSEVQMAWLDGGNGQNVRSGLGAISVDPPVDAIAEVKVMLNNYSAEYGGSEGGVVVETTKSGTNQFHGSGYEFLRNNAMDAPGFFAPVENGSKLSPELRYNVFGGTVGGPIRHDNTFFFFSYEGQRLRSGGTDVLTVPTPAERAGDFSGALNAKGQIIPIYDPSTTVLVNGTYSRQPFPANRIPASQLDAVGVKMASYYPLPNQPPSNLAGANNFSGNYADKPDANFVMIKVDHNFSDKDRVTIRYLDNRGTEELTSVYPDPGADPRGLTDKGQDYTFGSWIHILGPTQVNNFRFSYYGRYNHQESQGLGGDYPSKLGLQGVPDAAFPQIAPAGFTTMGSTTQERRQYPIRQDQWVDDYSWTRGRHVLKFGGEARYGSNQDVFLATESGAFSFSTQPTGLPGNASTGNGLASLLIGFPTAFSEQATEPLDRSSWYLAAFAEDVWSVTPNLTLNLGLRWETDTPLVDAHNRMNSFNTNDINPVSGTPGVVKFLGVSGYPTIPYRDQWKNFGPRLGFAWKVFGSNSTVIRGGFGIFYSGPFDFAANTSAALGFSTSVTLNSPDNGITAPFNLRNGVPPTSPAALTLTNSFGAVPLGTNPNTAVTYLDPSRSTGYSQQFNLGIQRTLRGGLVVEVTTLGNLSRKLPSGNLSLNQIPPSILGTHCDTQVCRPYPQFSDVQMLAPTLAVSNYYAGMVRVTKRYSKGLNLGASYTYSKYLTDSDLGGTNLGNNSGPYSNYYDRKADYGPSDNDIRHRLAMNWVYELPFGAGRHWLNTGMMQYLLGGWALGNVMTLQSGPPFTVTALTNTTNAFSAGPLRPDLLHSPILAAGQRKVGEWFDTSAFAQPAAFQFGNEGVGILNAAGLIDLDFSVLRDFRLKENTHLEIRGEFFNALNHTNFGLPGPSLGSATFGVVNSAGPARQIEVGARFVF